MSLAEKVSVWDYKRARTYPNPTRYNAGIQPLTPIWYKPPTIFEMELLSGEWYPWKRDARSFIRMEGIATGALCGILVLPGVYSDRHIRAKVVLVTDIFEILYGRVVDIDNFYFFAIYSADYIWLGKIVAGSRTTLTIVSYVIDIGVEYDCWLSITGTTLSGSPDGGVTVITATDPDFASGRWGIGAREAGKYGDFYPVSFGAPYTELKKPVGYFLARIIGSGKPDDPFRADIPECDHSAFIPTPKGKPMFDTCVVRVFDDESAKLLMEAGIKKIDREEAIRIVLQDDRLMIYDLEAIKETDPKFETILKDYIKHREGLGAIVEVPVIRRYLTREKGW